MDFLSVHEGFCPHCGEPIELVIDASSAPQSYVEDCQVCCRPIVVQLSEGFDEAGDEDGSVTVTLRREND